MHARSVAWSIVIALHFGGLGYGGFTRTRFAAMGRLWFFLVGVSWGIVCALCFLRWTHSCFLLVLSLYCFLYFWADWEVFESVTLGILCFL